MNNKRVLIWAVSAIVYVGIVIGVYTIFFSQNSAPAEHSSHQSEMK
ncbi:MULTISPECIES: hypothetical protein [Bacillus]|nr:MULTISPECIES: hypothetical protein [Bacillus]WFA04604.1 hypothetical protein P3X63_18700 [Bacillus sp. HSf4]